MPVASEPPARPPARSHDGEDRNEDESHEESQEAASPALFARLRRHFGTDPAKLPVVEQTSQLRARQPAPHGRGTARRPKPPPALVGVVLPEQYSGVSLAKLVPPGDGQGVRGGAGRVHRRATRRRPETGVRQAGAVHVPRRRPARRPARRRAGDVPVREGAPVAVMALDREAAERFARKLAKGVRHGHGVPRQGAVGRAGLLAATRRSGSTSCPTCGART